MKTLEAFSVGLLGSNEEFCHTVVSAHTGTHILGNCQHHKTQRHIIHQLYGLRLLLLCCSFKIFVSIPLTNRKEQRPSWEATSHSANQEIPSELLSFWTLSIVQYSKKFKKFGNWKQQQVQEIQGISTYGMLNQSNQPTQFGHFSHLDPPYQRCDQQLTGKISMIWLILLGFLPGKHLFGFYSIDGASDRNYGSKVFFNYPVHWFLSTWFSG
jgi:hypothetical protein